MRIEIIIIITHQAELISHTQIKFDINSFFREWDLLEQLRIKKGDMFLKK